MVAVNRRVTLLAISLASLSLAPSADAAAIHARSSDPGSPSKPARQHHARAMPLLMQSMKMARHINNKDHERDESKRSKFHKSRVAEVAPLGEVFSKRQDQARFDVSPKHVYARQAPAMQCGHVDITSPTGDSTDTPTKRTTMGHLMLNTTSNPARLDASETNMTTICMVPLDDSHCTLQIPISNPKRDGMPYCATFDPSPPAPEPLTAEPCFNQSAIQQRSTKSQTFLYNSTTYEIRPMWFNAEQDGPADAASASDEAVNDEEVNSEDDGGASATLTSRDSSENVTLVFVPDSSAASNVDQQFASSQSMSASAAGTDTVTTTVTASATSSLSAADIDPAPTTTDSVSQSTSSPAATPSLSAADVDPTSSATDPTSSLSTSMSADAPSATDVDAASSTGSPSSLAVSTTPTDASAPTSFAAEDFDSASSTTESTPSPTDTPFMSSTSDASDTSTADALDVEIAASPSSSNDAVSSTDITPTSAPSSTATTAPTDTTSPSSDSSIPTATSSTVDAAAIGDDIANSSASSSSLSSATPSPSSSVSAAAASSSVAPPTSDDQAVYVGASANSPTARAEMAPVSMTPYQWMFQAEPRL